MSPVTLDLDLLKEVEQFIYREARLQDELEYDEWEALWTDDAIYWVPANADDIDPTQSMSIIFDNRSRIRTRIKQLHTGKRHAQTPASRLRHLITNVELLGAPDHSRAAQTGEPGWRAGGEPEGDEVSVGANFLVYESRERGVTLWAGRTQWVLRRTEDGLRIARKKVMLVNNDRALNTLAFLI